MQYFRITAIFHSIQRFKDLFVEIILGTVPHQLFESTERQKNQFNYSETSCSNESYCRPASVLWLTFKLARKKISE